MQLDSQMVLDMKMTITRRNYLKVIEDVKKEQGMKIVTVNNVEKIPLGIRASLAKNYKFYLKAEN